MSTPSIEHKNIEKIYVDMQQRAQHQGIMHTDTKNEQKQSTDNKQGGHMPDSSRQKNQTTHDEKNNILCFATQKHKKEIFNATAVAEIKFHASLQYANNKCKYAWTTEAPKWQNEHIKKKTQNRSDKKIIS